VQKELLEIPAGGIDPGEDVETAVKREMQEETGYLPRKLVKLGSFFPRQGILPKTVFYLVLTWCPAVLVAEDTDSIRLVRVPVSEITQNTDFW